MRHRAPRPLIDLWRRLPRATARSLGELAKLGPVQALVALTVVLSLGTAAYVAVASVIDEPANRQAETVTLGQRPSPNVSRYGERPDLSLETPTSAYRTPHGSSSESSTPAAGQPQTPQAADETTSAATSPAIDVTPTPRSGESEATGSPSIGTATPSPSPSHQHSATTSSTPEDNTPPDTSLSEEFPDRETAVFSFSANEPASFTCSLDGAAYTPCESPMRYSDLDTGWHTFAVRATDAAGNDDPTPAEARWLARGGRSADR